MVLMPFSCGVVRLWLVRLFLEYRIASDRTSMRHLHVIGAVTSKLSHIPVLLRVM
jgi:hypothetical protein